MGRLARERRGIFISVLPDHAAGSFAPSRPLQVDRRVGEPEPDAADGCERASHRSCAMVNPYQLTPKEQSKYRDLSEVGKVFGRSIRSRTAWLFLGEKVSHSRISPDDARPAELRRGSITAAMDAKNVRTLALVAPDTE